MDEYNYIYKDTLAPPSNLTQASENQPPKDKFKKGAGSFRIPIEALYIMIEEKASAWQIGIFLTIARFTESSGKFSSAGYKAISKATGASPGSEKKPGRGRQMTLDLLKFGRAFDEYVNPKKKSQKNLKGILYTPEEWQKKTGESIPEIPHDLHSIRWVLNDFETDDWVWFPNSLVDGYGKFKQPLKRLKTVWGFCSPFAFTALCCRQHGRVWRYTTLQKCI